MPITYNRLKRGVYMIDTRLKDLRVDHDYSQDMIAKYLHIAQPTYSDYENEKINIPIEMFMKLADFYQTSIDYIVKWTRNNAPYEP